MNISRQIATFAYNIIKYTYDTSFYQPLLRLEIIVEMQNRGQEHFIDRALYYSSRVIVNQGEKGKWNYDLLPVYTICFMNFIDPNMPECKFRTDLTLADRDTGKVVSEKLRIIYLMLPVFEKEEGDCENDFERWIFVLRNMNTFERMPFMAKNAVFKKLAEISDIRSLSKKEMDKYEYSLRVMRDSYATYQYAAKNGWKKGVAEGMAQGMEKGMAQGMEKGMAEGMEKGMAQGKAEGKVEGEREKALAIARNLKTFGLSISQIAEATGLNQEEINTL